MFAIRCPRLIHTCMSRETAAWRALSAVLAAARPPSLARCAIAARSSAELGEVAAPLLGDAARIAQILLVQGVEELGVAAVEWCGFEHGENCRQASSLAEKAAGREKPSREECYSCRSNWNSYKINVP
jgi:hypothetical protein